MVGIRILSVATLVRSTLLSLVSSLGDGKQQARLTSCPKKPGVVLELSSCFLIPPIFHIEVEEKPRTGPVAAT